LVAEYRIPSGRLARCASCHLRESEMQDCLAGKLKGDGAQTSNDSDGG
jgi:hypothetical protein